MLLEFIAKYLEKKKKKFKNLISLDHSWTLFTHDHDYFWMNSELQYAMLVLRGLSADKIM